MHRVDTEPVAETAREIARYGGKEEGESRGGEKGDGRGEKERGEIRVKHTVHLKSRVRASAMYLHAHHVCDVDARERTGGGG